MAPRTRIITLNLGSQSIELAEFRTATPGDLVLCSYGSREILVEPGEKGIRAPQMTAAVCELLEELHIERGHVTYTIAEESVFSRFVELPAIGDEKIERLYRV